MGVLKKDALKTLIFALLVSVVVVFAIFELKKFQNEEEEKEAANRVVPFGSNEITVINYNGAVFERDAKKFTWRVTSPITDYLNYRLVEDWVAGALTEEGRDLSESDEKVNWVDFELDNDKNKIKFITKNKTETSVQLSSKEAFDGSTYLRVHKEKSERLYSGSAKWSEVFSKKMVDFRVRELFNWEVPEPSSLPTGVSFSKGGKLYLSLEKTDKWASKEFKDWSFNGAKIDSFMADLKTYPHSGFARKGVKLGDKLSTIRISTDQEKDFSLNFYKGDLATASYRPEHTLTVDKDAVESLMIDPLDLRAFEDVDGSTPNGEFDQVRISKNNKTQRFLFKSDIWTLSGDKKKQEKFNGARVFIFLDKLKKINYKRYISGKGIVFKSAKKRIYLAQKGKDLVKYSIGQLYPCEAKSRSYNCILVTSNFLKNSYLVAPKKEIFDLFRFDFNKDVKND